MTDADNTYPAEWAWVLNQQMTRRKLDLVIGQRIQNRFLSHRLGTLVIGGLTKVIFGAKTADIASGLRIMSKRYLNRFRFQPDEGLWLDMIIKAHKGGFRYGYEPIAYRPRTSGVSKIRGKGLKIAKRYLGAIWTNLKEVK
jgi:hypothetical protein